jgi:putative membrane protein
MLKILLFTAIAGLSLPAPGDAPLAAPQRDDAAILRSFEELVSADIGCAQLAAERGHSADVRNFAKTLVSEHGLARQLARDVAMQLNVTFKPNANNARAAEHEKVQKALRERPDVAFDVLFLRHQTEYHQELVNLINKEWLPAAKAEELSGLLSQVGPAFEAHTAMARQLWEQRRPSDGP